MYEIWVELKTRVRCVCSALLDRCERGRNSTCVRRPNACSTCLPCHNIRVDYPTKLFLPASPTGLDHLKKTGPANNLSLPTLGSIQVSKVSSFKTLGINRSIELASYTSCTRLKTPKDISVPHQRPIDGQLRLTTRFLQ